MYETLWQRMVASCKRHGGRKEVSPSPTDGKWVPQETRKAGQNDLHGLQAKLACCYSLAQNSQKPLLGSPPSHNSITQMKMDFFVNICNPLFSVNQYYYLEHLYELFVQLFFDVDLDTIKYLRLFESILHTFRILKYA